MNIMQGSPFIVLLEFFFLRCHSAFDNLIWPTFDTFIWPTLG